MAWSQAEIDALKKAIATGALSVHYTDRSVVYQSTDAMLKALALMEKEVNPAASPNYRLAQTSKGV